MKPKYPFIIAWGNMMGSFPYYIENQIRRATNDNAPSDAIYCDTDGDTGARKWFTVRDIKSQQSLDYVQGYVERMFGIKEGDS